MYRTVKQTAEEWGLSDRRIRVLCAEGKVPNVVREGRSWLIPENHGGKTRASTAIFDSSSNGRIACVVPKGHRAYYHKTSKVSY